MPLNPVWKVQLALYYPAQNIYVSYSAKWEQWQAEWVVSSINEAQVGASSSYAFPPFRDATRGINLNKYRTYCGWVHCSVN